MSQLENTTSGITMKIKPKRNLNTEQQAQAASELIKLIDCAGGIIHLSTDLGVSRQTVHNWINKKYISATAARDACKIDKYKEAGFTKEALCPDVAIWY